MAFDDFEETEKGENEMDVWRFGKDKAADAAPESPDTVDAAAEEEISLEKRYSIKSLQQCSTYLSKDSSSRYKAIILNAWVGGPEPDRYEVGVVRVDNGDDRNGVIHAGPDQRQV